VILYRQFEKDQSEGYRKVNMALASLYGQDWYRIEEKDPAYESFQRSRDSLHEVHLLPVVEALARKHPDSYASAFVLSGSGRQLGSLEKKEQLYKLLSARMKKTDPAQRFADYIQGLKSSGIGNTVANFILPDPKGKDVDFRSFKGKYVLIDFWASWCVPCRKSFPRMREVYKTFKGEQFEIYSISIDENKAAWLKVVRKENNPWPQSLDTKNVSQSGFAVTGVPATFLVDPKGKIIAKEVGFDPNGGSEIEKKLVALFGKKLETTAAEK
jgi:thiol-disulfide isomerase/thioredoxin